MARTPLMRGLMRLAGEHTEAGAVGFPLAEVRARRALAVSRRDFLAGAATAAVGAVLVDPGRAAAVAAAGGGGGPRIAIVGAGISGLSAALTLQDAGYTTAVFESSARIGGRMHSDTADWLNGQISEWCGELIDTGHQTIRALARRFKLDMVDLRAAQPKGADDTYYFSGHYYPQARVDTDFEPVYRALQEQTKAAGYPTLHNSYTPAGYALDHTSIYDWVERYVPGGHGSNMGRLLDVAYTIEYGADTTAQSALNLVYLLGSNSTPSHFSIFGASDERYHIAGGNEQLPRAIAASLPGGSIRTGCRVTSMARDSAGHPTLTVNTPTGTERHAYDRVILTLPFAVLRTLDYGRAGFDKLKTTAISQLGYGTNSKLQAQFDTRYWNGTGAWPGLSTGTIFSDVGFQNTWDATRAQPGATGIIVDYTGGVVGAAYDPATPYATSANSAPVRQYAQNFVQQLDIVWPGAREHYTGRATLSCPWRDPNLLGSYSYWKVGQYTLFSGYEGARQGAIHFAGEHCSQDFQGYMEGAASEGIRAANEILADYKAGVYP